MLVDCGELVVVPCIFEEVRPGIRLSVVRERSSPRTRPPLPPPDSMYLASVTPASFMPIPFLETIDDFVIVLLRVCDLDIILRLICITFSAF